jgi:mRNA-degrading endonuclease YafQ of YafQ-DinJ toxin-antitoxin module
MDIAYTPRFLRLLAKFPPTLQQEVKEAIRAFADVKNHPRLKVHKLHGRLADRFAFSVNYRYRVLFVYEKPNAVILVAVGDHDVYGEV